MQPRLGAAVGELTGLAGYAVLPLLFRACTNEILTRRQQIRWRGNPSSIDVTPFAPGTAFVFPIHPISSLRRTLGLMATMSSRDGAHGPH